jgi:hypothetical protein
VVKSCNEHGHYSYYYTYKTKIIFIHLFFFLLFILMCDFNAMKQCNVNERARGLGYYTF